VAEIKITKRTGGISDFEGVGEKSALSRIGTGTWGASRSAFSSFDARQPGEGDRMSSPDAGSIYGQEISSGQKGGSALGSETSGSQDGSKGLNISFGPGAVVVNQVQKSPEEIARDIVKPLSRELKKLGYLSS
jgi:hypothetical protein